jgi:hypothetical protein
MSLVSVDSNDVIVLYVAQAGMIISFFFLVSKCTPPREFDENRRSAQYTSYLSNHFPREFLYS